MKKLILFAAVIIFSSQSFSQTTAANANANEHAKELLKVMGSAQLAKQMMDMMIASYKQNLPDVPNEFWDEFQKEVSINDLLEMIAPIYTKYYTDDELLQLIAFYKSPLGQKLTEKLPLITQESYSVGEEWGKKIGQKAIDKLKAKGYLKNE
jgi:hypothetical protein